MNSFSKYNTVKQVVIQSKLAAKKSAEDWKDTRKEPQEQRCIAGDKGQDNPYKGIANYDILV